MPLDLLWGKGLIHTHSAPFVAIALGKGLTVHFMVFFDGIYDVLPIKQTVVAKVCTENYS